MLKNKIKIIKGRDFQLTLKEAVEIEGWSLYSGEKCNLEILPAPADIGLIFKTGGKEIKSCLEHINFEEKSHTTSLKKGNLKIKTVEHLLAALWGLGIDNAFINLSKPFIPFIDASAEYYVKRIQETGVKKLGKKRKYLKFKQKHKFIEKGDDRYAIFSPAEGLKIDSTISFDNIIGTQRSIYKWDRQSFGREIAWARSFLRTELDYQGEIWRNIRKKFKLLPSNPFYSPIVVFTKDKYSMPLKTPDELARHKILDFFGDIALLGIRIEASVQLFKPGHRFTRQIVREIASFLENK